MDERVLAFRVGVVVFAAAFITAVLVMMFGAWPNMMQPQYELNIQFPEAPGITVNTPVRKSGVLIGRVTDVKLQDEGGVLVRVNINKKVTLRRNESCRIGSGSILGDAILEFVPSGNDELVARFDKNQDGKLDDAERSGVTEILSDRDFINDGLVASNPLRVLSNLEDDIVMTFSSIQNAGNEVSQLARSVNSSINGNDGQFQRLMSKAESAFERFDTTMQTVERLLGNEELSNRMQTALEDLPEFLNETRVTMQEARTTLAGFQRVSDKAEANLDHLANFTEPLGQKGPQLVANIEESTDNLNALMEQLLVFGQNLNSGQGTLGRLTTDDELYERIDRITANVEDLTVRMRPIMDDVRIFTDKIARDPRQLGVKGALDRRPTGLKTGVIDDDGGVTFFQ